MVKTGHIAHIRKNPDGSETAQTAAEHCQKAAEYAKAAAGDGFESLAELAGIMHDMGKFRGEFDRYLSASAAGENIRRGSVVHTFSAPRYALENWGCGDDARSLTAEIIAFATGAHHGLFDCVAPDGEDGFRHRAEWDKEAYTESKRSFFDECISEGDLQKRFDAAAEEINAFLSKAYRNAMLAGPETAQDLFAFYIGMAARFILSCVIEGDRRDTAEFMNGKKLANADADWTAALRHMEELLNGMDSSKPINRARRGISDKCREAAKRPSGIYRLNVPTGAGKTLSSLRYALAHAGQFGKKRIFYVIPLLSVLEQNAAVLHRQLDGIVPILEHHSNVVNEKSDVDELDMNELLTESWQAPFIITTMVQLLNTLFSGKTTCIRRMNALRDSVIVIDEVQSIPRKMLSLFTGAVNFLSQYCGADIVLCSATQPCFEKCEYPIAYAENAEIVSFDEKIRDCFERTEIIDRTAAPGMTVDELSEFAVECAEDRSVLVICNKKTEAFLLWKRISDKTDAEVFHLSTAMCMAHRIRTLKRICDALENGKRIICVSTQLVEAGVDFSFGCVIRILAGLDNAAQSAGRCNRSGEYGCICPVYLVRLQNEDLTHLKDIYDSQLAAAQVLHMYAENRAGYGDGLTGRAAIGDFYTSLYRNMSDSQLFSVEQMTIGELLSLNKPSRIRVESCSYALAQAFRTAGESFKVFDDLTTDVIVPYGEGERIITGLCSEESAHDTKLRAALLKEAAKYTVSLMGYELKKLLGNGVQAICGGTVYVLLPEFYAEDTGFCSDGQEMTFQEV